MLIKNWRKGKYSTQKKNRICGISIFVLGAMYLFGRNYYEPSAENSIWNAFFLKYAMQKEEDVNLTDATLEKYNTYLHKIGSDKQLTEKDLEAILYSNLDEDETISIQVDEFEFKQIGTKTYNVCVDENGNLSLHFRERQVKRDFFKPLESEEDTIESKKVVLSTIGEFIEENGIQPIGYINSWPAWNDKEVKFVRENYGEDVLDCMQEYGFPIKAYYVQDFYDAYEKMQEVTR